MEKKETGKNKKNIARKLRSKKAVRWFWIIITAPFALLIFLIMLTALGLFGRLPSFEELENPRNNLATEIYSEDGQLLGSFFIQNRSYVDYSELNDSLVAALVSTEDMRYYSHSGIDFISLARVAFKTVAMGKKEQGGGSTITQQLAKNLFPRDTTIYNNSISRNSKMIVTKLKEWITAVKLEHNYTKEEILAMYLNTVFYGSNAYGIKSAAQTFFNKTPAELTINEAAMLVGVVNAPTMYSPVRNPERAMNRRNTVLSRMHESGFINKHELDSLSGLPILLDFKPITHNEGKGTYFREMLRMVMTAKKPTASQYNNDWDYRQALEQWETNPIYGWCHKNIKADGTPYDIYCDGLKIYTTINASMQQYAEEAVIDRLENDIQPKWENQYKRTNTIFIKTSAEDQEKIIRNAMRYSDRYRGLKNSGASDEQIDKIFNTPVEMKVFGYRHDIDTLMTPRDSIIYHKKILRASFMAMDPITGHVKAYVGGPDFKYFKYDMVKQGKRQVGSAFKPFVYTYGVDHLGMTPCTMVPNVPTVIETDNGEPWIPKEASSNPDIYDGQLHPLRWGLALSRNNYSAWIMKQAKQPGPVADFIHKMGIKSYIDPVPALCLGTPDVSLFEMVAAYSTFVNRGVYTEPIFVMRIEDCHGNLISTFSASSTDAISEQTAYTMLGMLINVVNAGTANRLRHTYKLMSEQIGGKTGTSQENRDAWFMGVTPRLVGGAWVGGEDQSVHLTSGGEGSAIALPIFGVFLQKVYADARLGINENEEFPQPVGVINYSCSDTAYTEEEAIGIVDDDDEFFD